ncbi:dihydrolipoyllysine-residue acetyltransferase component of pyruvate dehydrogenase complex, mitochondrial-like isoform X1 [Ornithodoros turicata]|uniref:dihydrolipoyllysine-residue acetyltransferase component of pyruvate dehydrogenase complex, mitochondrial-like isoform X1 n=1 Tax=Ornithodoros turicata TaxID=34597 RepID=UPI003139A6F5
MFRVPALAWSELRVLHRRVTVPTRYSRCCASRTVEQTLPCRLFHQKRFSLINLLRSRPPGSLLLCRRWYADLPPHQRVLMPTLSPTMEKGNIVSWSKKEGDKLGEGDVLCEIETDKATMGFETPEEGYLAKIIVPAGTKDIPLGQLICIMVPDQQSVAAFKDFKDDSASSAPKPATAAAAPAPPAAAGAAGPPRTLPRHLRVGLPTLSPTMETGTIKNWSKKEGDKLGEGDLLCEIETDKAAMGFETPEEGYLAKILVPAGTKDVPLGKLICILVYDPNDVAAFKDFKDDGAAAAPPPTPTTAVSPQPSTAPPRPTLSAPAASPATPARAGGHVLASPMAKHLAAIKGIDLAQVPAGSGPGGRILAKDLDTVSALPRATATIAPLPSSTAEYLDIPLSNLQQARGQMAVMSKQTIPHYYLTVDVTMDTVMRLRDELNETLKRDKVQLSVNDFVIKAAALACKKYPAANSSFQGDFIRQFESVDIGTTVDTPQGIVIPTIFGAHKKGLSTISQDYQALVTKAQENKLQPQDLQGATITVSYLGMFGVRNFSAIIIPPQACILAAGCPEEMLVPDSKDQSGRYRTSRVMYATLSCDHRVIDGAVGARWLEDFKEFLECPHKMLL